MQYSVCKLSEEFTKEYNKAFETMVDKPDAYNHYTTLTTLYKMLNNDSLQVSNTRFSNDMTEEKLVGQKWIDKERYNDDNYIACFCSDGDQLSQWRGYCNNGGVSIDMDLFQTRVFSLLHSDYETSNEFELCYNSPLPVIYSEGNVDVMTICRQAFPDETTRIQQMKEIIPFLKHRKFFEEHESRLVFTNRNNMLAKCICYRDIGNDTKVPYIVIKMGNCGSSKASCRFNMDEFTEEELRRRSVSDVCFDKIITIPQGYNQEMVFSKLASIVDEFNASQIRIDGRRSIKHEIKIFCEGHIPVRKITIAPKQDRERVKEQIAHYCKSKYWLRYVEVVTSEIPYVSSAN